MPDNLSLPLAISVDRTRGDKGLVTFSKSALHAICQAYVERLVAGENADTVLASIKAEMERQIDEGIDVLIESIKSTRFDLP